MFGNYCPFKTYDGTGLGCDLSPGDNDVQPGLGPAPILSTLLDDPDFFTLLYLCLTCYIE